VSKRKLLLADDSVTIQKVVNLTFADEGIEVITVGDGDSAMEKISQLSPDVVLADVHMPGLNGYQICEIVRENPTTRDLPVVLLVGSFEPFDENEAARVGANAFLTKPFQSIRQLVSQVSDLMEAPRRETEAAAAATEESVPETAASFEQEAAAPQGEAVTSFAEREAAASATGGAAPETNDIESLYERSFSEPEAEHSELASPPQHYVDAGMDDEMIETSHAGDIPEEHLPTEEYNVPVEFETEAPEAAVESETAAASPFDSIATPAVDSVAEETGGVRSEPYFEEFPENEPPISLDHATESDLKLDEVDLLELPPVENGKTLEFTTTQRMAAEGSNKQIVSLSPELMDMIVQKVVEKLSEKY
jgi:CheY-like chemotaxis protein